MNTRNFCKTVTLDKIVGFFEDRNLRYQIKKSNRERFADQYEELYNSYKHLRMNYLGEQINKGTSKIVYQSKTNENKVIKVCQKRFEGLLREKQNYDFLVSKNLGCLVPKTEFYDFYCISEKVKTSEKHFVDDTLRKIIKDRYPTNFGVLNNRSVCVDTKTLDRTYVEDNLSVLQNLTIDTV